MQGSFLSTLRAAVCSAAAVAAILLVGACRDSGETTAPLPVILGQVLNSATGEPVAGAQVSIGTATRTTRVDGRFHFTALPAGPAKLKAAATGFEEFEEDITVTAGDLVHDVQLTRIERFDLETFSVYIPATVKRVNGILLALGGPDTRGFAAATPFGAPLPAVEASLQTQGEQFRALAASRGLAVVGTSISAMPNSFDNDQLILEAIEAAAAASGRWELPGAPILIYGLSTGAPQATAFTIRNPARIIGLFLKVPFGLEKLASTAVPGLPTYMVLAEFDAFVNNAKARAMFDANRASGALWALALERGVPHHALSPAQRSVTLNWMTEILSRRLDAGVAPMASLSESRGWIGDPATGAIGPSETYLRDRSKTSWFPSEAIAKEWQTFTGLGSN